MGNFDPNAGALPFVPIYGHQLSPGLRACRYMVVERVATHPKILENGTQASPVIVPTLPTAAQGGIDTVHIEEALGLKVIELFQTTAQTLMPARHATKGLEIGLDEVNNESVEYVPGGNHAANPLGCLAGTDPGVFIRATLEIADVSGSDQLVVGFRKQEAYAVPTSFLSAGDALYTDFYGVGFSGSANPNDVKTVRDLNNGGSTTVFDTNFNWADNGIHTLEVRVKGRKVSVFINGVALGGVVKKDGIGAAISAQQSYTPPAFSFDAGDFLIPFIFSRYDATLPGAIYLRKLVCGRLVEDGLDPAQKVGAF
jgi:hypothetical protein